MYICIYATYMFVTADIDFPGLFPIIHSRTCRYMLCGTNNIGRKSLSDWQWIWGSFIYLYIFIFIDFIWRSVIKFFVIDKTEWHIFVNFVLRLHFDRFDNKIKGRDMCSSLSLSLSLSPSLYLSIYLFIFIYLYIYFFIYLYNLYIVID